MCEVGRKSNKSKIAILNGGKSDSLENGQVLDWKGKGRSEWFTVQSRVGVFGMRKGSATVEKSEW